MSDYVEDALDEIAYFFQQAEALELYVPSDDVMGTSTAGLTKSVSSSSDQPRNSREMSGGTESVANEQYPSRDAALPIVEDQF